MAKDLKLSAEQLLQAYALGIFPMADSNDSSELQWYDPPRRGIIPLDRIHISTSLAKRLRQNRFQVTIDAAFTEVIGHCASTGMGGYEDRTGDTWISGRIAQLYGELHTLGHAHSLEVWQEHRMVGGLYGIALGSAFFGESMFSRVRDASKVALAHLLARLIRQGFTLCDTQYLTPHLATFGGIEISRDDYRRRLAAAIARPTPFYSASVSSGTGSSTGADVTGAEVAALLTGAAADVAG